MLYLTSLVFDSLEYAEVFKRRRKAVRNVHVRMIALLHCWLPLLSHCRLTCFVCGDGQLVAGVTVADDVLGDHADVVGGGRVQVDDGGLVKLGRHVFGYLC